MSPRQYKFTERAIEAFLLTVVLAAAVSILLGVYALADLVF